MKYPIIIAGSLGLLLVGGLIATFLPENPDAASSESPDEAAIISAATSGSLTATAGKFSEATCNESTDYDAQVIDLNADGQPEVFTQIYGTCLGGQAGVNLNLYIKDASGQWNPQFGFPGLYSVLESKNLGYPDIEIGGPGTCFPVWRWNGELYELYKNCPL